MTPSRGLTRGTSARESVRVEPFVEHSDAYLFDLSKLTPGKHRPKPHYVNSPTPQAETFPLPRYTLYPCTPHT
jgi:hypothetical protein